MRRAGRWRRPEDRQAAKAARFRLTASPGEAAVCLRSGHQRWEDASRHALPLRHTAEGDVEGRSPPHYPRRGLPKPSTAASPSGLRQEMRMDSSSPGPMPTIPPRSSASRSSKERSPSAPSRQPSRAPSTASLPEIGPPRVRTDPRGRQASPAERCKTADPGASTRFNDNRASHVSRPGLGVAQRE